MKFKKAASRARAGRPIRQVGVLPYRQTEGGSVELLLVSTRTTHRILSPKGWRMKGKSDPEAALIEAMEEAGVKGKISSISFGRYRYWKRMKHGFVQVDVEVYPLLVTKELRKWPEKGQRTRQWVDWKDARVLIDEPGLVALVDAFMSERCPSLVELRNVLDETLPELSWNRPVAAAFNSVARRDAMTQDHQDELRRALKSPAVKSLQAEKRKMRKMPPKSELAAGLEATFPASDPVAPTTTVTAGEPVSRRR